MKFGKFSDYRGGWLVGDFNPSLFKTNANDIGVLYCKEGEKGDGHFHKEHVEYNVILDGSVLIDDYGRNVKEWKKNKGIPIKYKSANQAIADLRKIGYK